MKRYWLYSLSLLLLIIVGLVACSKKPTPDPVIPTPQTPERITYTFDDELMTQGSVTGNGITLTFDKTADWDSGNGVRGFTANLTVINNTTTDKYTSNKSSLDHEKSPSDKDN